MQLITRLREWRASVTLMDDPRYSLIGQAADEIERLRLWIRRIDNINDNPARFSKEIDEACIDALAGKPMTGLITVEQKWVDER